MSTNPPLVEVRVPTHRRPEFLRRALRSLQGQSHARWQGVVLDDSPDQEGRAVVEGLGDSRLIYRPNGRNLGMVANLRQAFAKGPMVPGAAFACVLEDDNAFEESLLAENLRVLTERKIPLLMRNTRIVDMTSNGPYVEGALVDTGTATLSDEFGAVARVMTLRERMLHLFFDFGLPNLGYFWSLDGRVDLEVAGEVWNTHIQEKLRSIEWPGEYWYEPQSLALFTRFPRKGPAAATAENRRIGRLYRFSELRFNRRLLHRLEAECGVTSAELWRLAQERRAAEVALDILCEARIMQFAWRVRDAARWKRMLKLPLLWAYGVKESKVS